MKKVKILSSLVTVLLLMGISDCKQVAPEPKTELEKLPPATQQGKYTFGCLVNGKAMVPDNTLDVVAIYQLGSLVILGRTQNNGVSQAIVFLIEDSMISEKTYQLDDTLRTVRYVYTDIKISCDHNTDGSLDNTGILTITKFDWTNLIVSGTFSITVSPPGCPKYVITEGRFDLKFII